jgi:hypothetical protein
MNEKEFINRLKSKQREIENLLSVKRAGEGRFSFQALKEDDKS